MRLAALALLTGLLAACGQGSGPSVCLTGATDADRQLHEDWWTLYGATESIPASNGAKYGLIGPDKTVIAPFVYDDMDLSGEGTYIVECGDRKGLLSKDGEEIVPARYHSLRPFADGLAAYGTRSKEGYISPNGETAIEPSFYWAGDFSEGLAPVGKSSKAYGYIDRSGTYVIEPTFVDADPFSEGLAAVSVGATNADDRRLMDVSTGYIDTSGELVIPPRYITAYAFEGGWAKVYARYQDCPGKTNACDRAITRDGEFIGPDGATFVIAHNSGYPLIARGEALALYAPDGRMIVPFQTGGYDGIDRALEERGITLPLADMELPEP